ncbi:proteasome-type protease [Rhodovulum euryhalinum]|uniref:Putative proteasome-type protease n=1 Tax=Rhodovulum euryhalinum TaxID=35805 RepID=A0A4R2KQH9_9RHOB|nr:proteasome-type protease [Rhodovulum euryhalinum]TCO72388.1 putative proteasome-type protease [Rhodovulum euryhalinum]
MTYCVGLMLDRGLVMMADTRTNAGIDNISTFRKMFTWSVPGERVLMLMTAGNLATTQSVVSLLDERTKAVDEREPSILAVPSMFQAARLVAETLRGVIAQPGTQGQRAEGTFNATLILGGQIKGGPVRLFLIYPEGNFIEAGGDTPFFQIGETKYGRPILVRAYDRAMSFESVVKLLLVSFDSTVKANLSVAPPFDVQLYEAGSFTLEPGLRIAANDPYYQAISAGWGEALKTALDSLPDFDLGQDHQGAHKAG